MIVGFKWLVNVFNRIIMTSGNELMHLEYTLQCIDVCLWTHYCLCDMSSRHLDRLNLVFDENHSASRETLERLKELQGEMNGFSCSRATETWCFMPKLYNSAMIKTSPDKVYCSDHLIISTSPSCTSPGFQGRKLHWLCTAAWVFKIYIAFHVACSEMEENEEGGGRDINTLSPWPFVCFCNLWWSHYITAISKSENPSC